MDDYRTPKDHKVTEYDWDTKTQKRHVNNAANHHRDTTSLRQKVRTTEKEQEQAQRDGQLGDDFQDTTNHRRERHRRLCR
ncbi:hypothetical protein KUCAC02_009695 [Chaenocephalus aceratus]|nr:hypothetical protein KUCAC02_009695 [Chaenocephalus aceratus]